MASGYNQYVQNGIRRMQQGQQAMVPPPMPGYTGAIPEIAQAYGSDPMTRLAANALASGVSTAPVAGGKYAWIDGLSRVGQAILGKVIDDRQRKKYGEQEAEYIRQFSDVSQLASAGGNAVPNPGAAPDGAAVAAAALGGQPAPQPVAAAPAIPASNMPPSQPMQAAAAALGWQEGVRPPMDASGAPLPRFEAPFPMTPGPAPFPQGGTGPSRGATPARRPAPVSASTYFRNGIVPIEGGTDRNGKFLTSPKGAYGPSQLMPGTAPEAMQLAGFSRDDKRWRTDAEINLKAGEAYFAKQLATFGDPLKAAAAYNAGPGRVQRALRRAQRSGGDWVQYLPDETKKYVVNFQQAVGSTPAEGGGAGRSVEVPQLSMEQVPDRPAPPPDQLPAATPVPIEVESNRIAMAQQMLRSRNPYMAAIARQYLDKGLDEQFSARQVQNSQQFTQNQNRDNTLLADWQGGRGDARRAGYDAATAAESRNFSREVQNNQNQFNAINREDQQAFDNDQRIGAQEYNSREAEKQRQWSSNENALNRENKIDLSAQRQQQRSAYWNSPSGLKLRDEHNKEIKSIDETISKYQQFMQLNERNSTGGILAVPLIGDVAASFGDEGTMSALANDTALSKIGGSLGTAISDGDRRFIERSNISLKTPGSQNRNIATAVTAMLQRRKDYLYEFGNAEADNRGANFQQEWRLYSEQVPIVQYRNGRPVGVNSKPMSFNEWRKSRRRFDALGREIK